ncbi:MAG TPA: hypothetical protein IAC14_04355 [Candidatus Scybalomonas excrementigallinarum]|nr:hypothetical protein [Candidatus Scybalomonas excrementigallinarum]
MDIDGASEELKRVSGKTVEKINSETYSRAFQVGNALRNAELKVMSGKRSGRVYKKVGTYGKRKTQGTKALMGQYGHKLRGGQLYQASAPGEPPAVRTGTLRRSFTHKVQGLQSSSGIKVVASLETRNKYAGYLQDGTKKKDGTTKMAPRPFKEEIIKEAMPEVEKILNRSYE